MYDYIKGALAELSPAAAVIEAAGVGYLLNISLQTYSEIEGDSEAKLYVHQVVREDALLLYGFSTKPEREIFRLLIGVSGIGAATARMVLSTYAPRELSSIIATGNSLLLKNVKGLGLKTAEKIILELRDKILGVTADHSSGGAAMSTSESSSAVMMEAVSALVMLGFQRGPSEKVVRALLGEHPSVEVEEIIRMSLKKL